MNTEDSVFLQFLRKFLSTEDFLSFSKNIIPKKTTWNKIEFIPWLFPFLKLYLKKFILKYTNKNYGFKLFTDLKFQ